MSRLILKGTSGKIYKTNSKYIRIGITSKSGDIWLLGRHIILLDYDNFNPDTDLKRLQHKFKLPNFYIFKTSKGRYSSMCFYPVKFSKYAKILKDSLCDSHFKYYTLRSKLGTIRITKKPEKKTSILQLADVITSRYYYKENQLYKQNIFKLIELNGGKI